MLPIFVGLFRLSGSIISGSARSFWVCYVCLDWLELRSRWFCSVCLGLVCLVFLGLLGIYGPATSFMRATGVTGQRQSSDSSFFIVCCRDSPTLMMHECRGFEVPEWMLIKIRAAMRSLRSDGTKRSRSRSPLSVRVALYCVADCRSVTHIHTHARTHSQAHTHMCTHAFMYLYMQILCFTPVLPLWHIEDPGHFAQNAGDGLHLDKYTPLTQ